MLLVNNQTSYGAQIDTGSVEVQWREVDMTGAFGYNLALTNTFSGQPPTQINFTDITPGGGINGIASLQSASHVAFNGSEFSNCILSGCQGLVTNGSFVGPLTM